MNVTPIHLHERSSKYAIMCGGWTLKFEMLVPLKTLEMAQTIPDKAVATLEKAL